MLEPLKYAKVAMDASVSRQKVDGCILGTTSLLSHCLGKGENVALVLRDVGVLIIEGRRVQMRFYYDFLERMTGKRILESVAFKVSVLVSPLLGQTHSGSPALLACSLPGHGQLFMPRESTVPPPLAALNSSTIEFLGHIEDILPSPRSSIAGSPAAGHGAVSDGAHRFPDFHWPRHRLSRVSEYVGSVSLWPRRLLSCSLAAFVLVSTGVLLRGHQAVSRLCLAWSHSCEQT